MSRRDAEALRAAGHQAEWIGDWSKDPGDKAVLQHAHNGGAVLITLDNDFGELIFLQGQPHSGLIRLIDIPMRERAALLLETLHRYQDELYQGHILTVDADRVRVTPSTSCVVGTRR
jgi:predicted nuclease of predicted toxin-antitoxin system